MSDGVQPPRPGTGRFCPGCGVVVSAGYPRCPKCHAAMPGVPLPPGRAPMPGRFTAGGTSVDPDRRLPLLVVAVVGALVVLIALIYVLSRGDGKNVAAEGEGASVVEVDDASDGGSDEADEPDTAAGDPAATGTDPAAGERGSRADRLRMTRTLAGALQDQRLWSTVDLAPTDDHVVVIQSQVCADPGVASAIGEARGELSAAGVSTVRCVEQHGPMVFEQLIP